VFLHPGGDRKPTDPLEEKRWHELVALPTDVVLRTTDHLGQMLADMQEQQSTWLDAVELDPKSWPFFHDAYLDAIEEFDAGPFIAAHGYYRQATAGLRNALEVMTHACRFAVANDEAAYLAWRAGAADPPKFGNSVDIIGTKNQGKLIDSRLGGSGLFGNNPDGVLRNLYADVCRYAHSQPGFTNGDIWQSNGPVFIPRAFTQYWLDFCDTSLACFALLKMTYPEARGDVIWVEIAGNAGPSWNDLAEEVVEQLGISS
jgi:hypothetical protein